MRNQAVRSASLTCEEADRLGGEEAGYEQIRPPTSPVRLTSS